eukprot:4734290-Pyramimonas_sp.AAC.1
MSIPDSPRGRSTWRDSVPKSPRPQKCRRRKLSVEPLIGRLDGHLQHVAGGAHLVELAAGPGALP